MKTCHLLNFRVVPFFLFAGVALLLSGCGSARYRADYNGFNAAYADSSNRQMLLNLARLDQHDPTYFLQFGQISVQYQLSSSLNVVGNETVPSVTGAATREFGSPLATGTATVGAAASTTPSFTFIPVTDEKVAQQLLLPVDPEVLYTLFQQGWPVDQLMRLMVDRIEVPQADGTTIIYYNTPGSPFYTAFLKACAVARELQADGHLTLEAKKIFTAKVDGVEQKDPPKVSDIVSLETDMAKGGDPTLTWGQLPDGNWSVGSFDLTPIFKLEGGSEETFTRLMRTPVYEGQTLANMKAILGEGFSVMGKPTTNQVTNASPHLVLRSFLGILASASQEQVRYNHYVLNRPSELAKVPDIERLPIIRLRWDSGTKTLSPVVDLNYRGVYYQVTDAETTDLGEKASWNRDVFRLMVQLSSQVSIDISKYPLPTTLQVSP